MNKVIYPLLLIGLFFNCSTSKENFTKTQIITYDQMGLTFQKGLDIELRRCLNDSLLVLTSESIDTICSISNNPVERRVVKRNIKPFMSIKGNEWKVKVKVYITSDGYVMASKILEHSPNLSTSDIKTIRKAEMGYRYDPGEDCLASGNLTIEIGLN